MKMLRAFIVFVLGGSGLGLGLAQPAAAQDGGARPAGPSLRELIQSQGKTPPGTVEERRLSAEERARLRQQIRQSVADGR
jgi:hypothetical protein